MLCERKLYSTTALAAALMSPLMSAPASADTQIDTKTTTPLSTSSAGDITITEDGEIKSSSGAAVTVDSDNDVTNEGVIDGGEADGAAGIRIKAGTTADISNEGDITLDETFQPDDDNNDRIVDDSLASASNRYGIYVEAGADTRGSITNSGDITVEGNNSGGIVVDSDYTGDISTSGSITVIGNNSYGVRTKSVDGDVTIRGKVTVKGTDSIAVSTEGDISGTLTFQGTISQQLSHETEDGTKMRLSREDVRRGTPAVHVAGNVDGGIIIAVPPENDDSDDDDEDDDGIKDADEGSGSITSVGNGPALLIAGTSDTVIGTVAGRDGFSLVIDGAIAGSSGYSSTDAFGLVIGGEGGNVDVTGGILNTGSLSAKTVSANATALLINAGSSVRRLVNSGTIGASITTGGDGELYAIRDLSGTLTSIENTGFINVSGTTEDLRRAISLENTTADVTITQKLSAEDAEAKRKKEEDDDEPDTTVYTAITGDIVLGSGDDLLDIQAGRVTGTTFFNAGNDTLRLSGDADYRGTVDFGSGGGTMSMSDEAKFTGILDAADLTMTLTLSDDAQFRGSVRDGANLTVNVNGGSFGPGKAETVTIGTLNVAAQGALTTYIDTAKDKSSLFMVDTANFADGAKVSARLSSLEDAEGTYTFLRASRAINGLPEIAEEDISLPFIFAGTVAQSGLDLTLTIARKEADELDLQRSASQAYDAVFETSQNESALSESLLDITTAAELQEQIDKFLPDHAGGIFDAVTQGSRIASRHLSDPHWMYEVTNVGAWLEPIIWNSKKDAGDTVSFQSDGWGISAGGERWSKLGYIGMTYSYLNSSVENNGGSAAIDISQHELGAHWRIQSGPLLAFAKASGAYLAMDSTRALTGTEDGPNLADQADGKWDGWLYSGKAGASLELDWGSRLSFRPKLSIEYFRLDEDGYGESSSNDAFALDVEKRSSTALNGEASLTAAYQIGTKRRNNQPLTVEVEGGRRHNFSGSLGDTTAQFDDGDAFTLTGDELVSNYFGEARLLTGGEDHTWLLSGRVERRFDHYEYSVRASISAAF